MLDWILGNKSRPSAEGTSRETTPNRDILLQELWAEIDKPENRNLKQDVDSLVAKVGNATLVHRFILNDASIWAMQGKTSPVSTRPRAIDYLTNFKQFENWLSELYFNQDASKGQDSAWFDMQQKIADYIKNERNNDFAYSKPEPIDRADFFRRPSQSGQYNSWEEYYAPYGPGWRLSHPKNSDEY